MISELISETQPVKRKDESRSVLLAPVNICGQAFALSKGLRKYEDIYARSFQYTKNKHSYPADMYVDETMYLSMDREQIMLKVLEEILQSDFDTIMFFQKTFLFDVKFRQGTGLDLPLVAHSGRKILNRFTGWDLRREEDNKKLNPYSAFKYGYELQSYQDDYGRKIWLDYLRGFSSGLIVVDEEMRQYCPEAKIVPRVIDLDLWQQSGEKANKVPLLLHAPTDPEFKGSKFIRQALDELASEGFKFEYQEVSGLKNEDLKLLMEEADVYIDQLHLGWYGVAAIECMAIGTPVCCYIQESLEDAFNQHVPVHNVCVDNLKSKLKQIISDRNLRDDLSLAGRKFVEKNHSVKVVANALAGVINEIGGGANDIRTDLSGDWLGIQLESQGGKTRCLNETWKERLALREDRWRNVLSKREAYWKKAVRSLANRKNDLIASREAHWKKAVRSLANRKNDLIASREAHWKKAVRSLANRKNDLIVRREAHWKKIVRNLANRKNDLLTVESQEAHPKKVRSEGVSGRKIGRSLSKFGRILLNIRNPKVLVNKVKRRLF